MIWANLDISWKVNELISNFIFFAASSASFDLGKYFDVLP